MAVSLYLLLRPPLLLQLAEVVNCDHRWRLLLPLPRLQPDCGQPTLEIQVEILPFQPLAPCAVWVEKKKFFVGAGSFPLNNNNNSKVDVTRLSFLVLYSRLPPFSSLCSATQRDVCNKSQTQ